MESARVDGQSGIVHQAYLGSAEKLAALVKERTAPLPSDTTSLKFGLPGALWLAAQRTGVFGFLRSLWPASRSGPSPAYYLLLAVDHRVCQPGPRTEIAAWYDRSILRSQWGFAPKRFTPRKFWDCFDQIPEAQLDQAQIRLPGLWKENRLANRRIRAYYTTNFYTYVASANERSHLVSRGYNKPGRHNLRQAGLSQLLDGENGIRLCHQVCPGHAADADEPPEDLVGQQPDRS